MEAFWPSLLTPYHEQLVAVSGFKGAPIGQEECSQTYLASEVGSTTLGDLEDDGALLVASSLKARDDGGGGSHVLK